MEHFGCCYEIPEVTLTQLAGFFKERFGMDVIQIVGNAQAATVGEGEVGGADVVAVGLIVGAAVDVGVDVGFGLAGRRR